MPTADAPRLPGTDDGPTAEECPPAADERGLAEPPGLAGRFARAICSLRAGTRLVAGFALPDPGFALVWRGP